MTGFQFRLNGRGKSGRRREPIRRTQDEDTQSKKNPFQNGSNSDSDDDDNGRKPVKRKVSQIILEPSHQVQKRPRNLKPQTNPATNSAKKELILGEKPSQIARLVARRKEAQNFVEETQNEKEGKEVALFKFDIASCVDETTTDKYKEVPIDGFGEMLLKSMGWSGSVQNKRKKGEDAENEWKPRPQRLGLGAKLQDVTSAKDKKEAHGHKAENLSQELQSSEAHEDSKGVESESVTGIDVTDSNKAVDRTQPTASSQRRKSRFA